MKRLARWFGLALGMQSALATGGIVAGCSGGTSPVETVGGPSGEMPWPSAGPIPTAYPGSDHGMGTMEALCTRACAHLRTANCRTAPVTGISTCAANCSYSGFFDASTSTPAECEDELAAIYDCILNSHITCSTTGSPQYPCRDQEHAYSSCASPSSTPSADCSRFSWYDSGCTTSQRPHYYVCQAGALPQTGCTLDNSGTGYCCP